MPSPDGPKTHLHVLVKPIGPICNLDCSYCFYLPKTALYPGQRQWRMTDETLEAYIRQYVAAQPDSVDGFDFAFQGGEPTLMGLDFFRRVIELERKYLPPGKQARNSLQTNGVLLDDEWCEFLRAHQFLVGLSLDGPAELHDAYRRDKQARPTFDRVLRGMRCLQKHGVDFNVLTCLNRQNGGHGARVYRFLRDCGVEHMQFIPIVQRRDGVALQGDPGGRPPEELVSPQSILPEQYGRFLSEVFDLWVRRDVGRIFIRDFDQALAAWLGAGATLCIYARTCGQSTALEHNGDLYSCDHFVEADYRLGNIHEQPIVELANAPRQGEFGRFKEQSLPDACRRCPLLFACNGACPKDRFLCTADGQPGLNYLCAGYKLFFAHIGPTMQAMAAEVASGGTAAAVAQRLWAQQRQPRRATPGDGLVGRNGPCPCGSGRKFKSCCMRKADRRA